MLEIENSSAKSELVAHVVTAARNLIGDGLERVILYGSYVWGNRTPESDIDVAILVADGVTVSPFDLVKLVDEPIQLYFCPARRADSHRRFRICMNAKIVNDGVVIFDSGRRYDALDADTSRKEVFAKRYENSRSTLRVALKSRREATGKFAKIAADKKLSIFATQTLLSISVRQALFSAVFGLHAYLLDHDIDPSPKALRWSVSNLLDAAAWFDPSWQSLKPYGEALKPEFQFPEDRDIADDPITVAEASQCLQAAVRIHWKLRAYRREAQRS